jgi:hypothetical protein
LTALIEAESAYVPQEIAIQLIGLIPALQVRYISVYPNPYHNHDNTIRNAIETMLWVSRLGFDHLWKEYQFEAIILAFWHFLNEPSAITDSRDEFFVRSINDQKNEEKEAAGSSISHLQSRILFIITQHLILKALPIGKIRTMA